MIVLNPSAFAMASRGNVLPTVKENPGGAIESFAAWVTALRSKPQSYLLQSAGKQLQWRKIVQNVIKLDN
jgi:hypothetical protein